MDYIEIGDVCEGQYFMQHTDRNGKLCYIDNIITIDAYDKDSDGNVQPPGTYYCCMWEDGIYGSSLAENLKPYEVLE